MGSTGFRRSREPGGLARQLDAPIDSGNRFVEAKRNVKDATFKCPIFEDRPAVRRGGELRSRRVRQVPG